MHEDRLAGNRAFAEPQGLRKRAQLLEAFATLKAPFVLLPTTGEVAKTQEQQALIPLGVDIAWFESDSAARIRQRFLMTAQESKRTATIIEHLGIIGIDRKRALIAGHGVLMKTKFLQHIAAIV